jgi:glutathione peroxidase
MWFSVIVAALIALGYYKYADNFVTGPTGPETSIFNFTVDRVDDGQPVSLSEFKGKKAYLVVNVASQCGLTDKNYAELQQVYDKYRYLFSFTGF